MNFCLLNATNLDILNSGEIVKDISHRTTTKGEVYSDKSDQFRKVNVSLRLPMSAKFASSLQPHQNTLGKYEGSLLASSEISLLDMSRAVPSQYHHYTIRVLLNLPSPVYYANSSVNQQNINEEVYACFNIEAPFSLLQDLNSSMHLQQECSIPQESSAPRKLLAHTGDHLPPSWCSQKGASQIKLEYSQEPSWTVFITSEDKRMINLHLMATSVFLFALLGVIVLVMFVRGTLGSRKLVSQRHSTEANKSDGSQTRLNSA